MDWDWATAARELRHAIALNPRYVSARLWLSYYLVFVEDRFEDGIAHGRRAVELDPLAPLPSMQLGMSLMGRAGWKKPSRRWSGPPRSRRRCFCRLSIWVYSTTSWGALPRRCAGSRRPSSPPVAIRGRCARWESVTAPPGRRPTWQRSATS